ncbi:L-seryl-tRNA(Sec) selenium transferase [Bacillus massiliigorillae]|uniref:L-seryl-tRNA(Sec) selenium transferase n=1 Tax=Bacillus massiliigorillae TaxID=1243664 RepID=UPI0003A2E81A|nr:L-seryl-tRNA(Sec) selenium transferase [Bacillus massiliigorillae]
MNTTLKNIPAIHALKMQPMFQQHLHTFAINEKDATQHLRKTLDSVREKIIKNAWDGPNPGSEQFIEIIFKLWSEQLHTNLKPKLKRVINATGTVLHTNLGRAKLSPRAIKQIVEISAYNSNLEFDLEKGERGKRTTFVEEKLKEITGAEAAYVVNNNAAAVFLILKAFGKEKEVIISRGQLIEIGGSFRISSIMEESGAILREVGTTNKTHLFDYEKAITDETAILMKVHTSNFKTIGFTKSVSTEELVQLKRQNEQIIFYEDLGSGAFYPFTKHGIGDEELVKDIIDKGVDLVSFSGDKLLGGPQVGIIVGKKKYIDVLKTHQLARVLRVDKLNLAALEATMLDYLTEPEQIPTIKNITITIDELEEKAKTLMGKLLNLHLPFDISIQEDLSTIGGGTMPGVTLPTMVLSLKPHYASAQDWKEKLQKQPIPIIARIHQDALIFDVRTIDEEEFPILVDVFGKLCP